MRTCDASAEILSEFKVYMRYTGQGWEIPVVLSEAQAMAPDAEVFERLFEDDYAKLFGRTVTGLDIEITVWSVNATTPAEKTAQLAEATPNGAAESHGTREIFDPRLANFAQAQIVERGDMSPGATVTGPAVITEDETTIIVPASRRAIGQADGCIDLRRKGGET